jgi:hypothetical protein
MLRGVYRERGWNAITSGNFLPVKSLRSDAEGSEAGLGDFCVFWVL